MKVFIINRKGNIKSICNILLKCGITSQITDNPDDILNANKVILPGVGSFDYAIKFLKENKLDLALKEFIKKKENHLLGICLGMHLLFESSEEGKEDGLGFIRGNVIKFKTKDINFKIPHMGWNFIENYSIKSNFKLEKQRFYFAHSYYASPIDNSYKTFFSNYIIKFPAIVEKDNIIGFQFHPEKSHNFGKNILNQFINL